MKKNDRALILLGMLFCLSLATLSYVQIIKSQNIQNSVLFGALIGMLSSSLFAFLATLLYHQRLFVFGAIFENANDSITIIDKNGKYVWQNRSNREFCGFETDELKEQKANFFINNTDTSLKDELDNIEEFSGIFSALTKTGYKKVWFSAFRVHDELDNTLCYVEMKRNVGEFLNVLEKTKNEKDRLEKKTKMDFLTGIYNRLGFLSELDELLQIKDTKGCIVFIDIDKFKNINDTHGHEMGDKILQHTVNTISANIRQADVLARWGGEEFVLWLGASTKQSYEICEKIRSSMEFSNPFGIRVTCSFGIENIKDSVQEAVKNADEAMYEAKNNGRNRVIFFENKNQNS